MNYPVMKFRWWRRRQARRWMQWRVKHGAPIPHVHKYDVLTAWHINQIEQAIGLPLSSEGRLAVDCWLPIAAATGLPRDTLTAESLNAAIDYANAKRRAADDGR